MQLGVVCPDLKLPICLVKFYPTNEESLSPRFLLDFTSISEDFATDFKSDLSDLKTFLLFKSVIQL